MLKTIHQSSKDNEQNNGLTVVELVIVVGIIVVLAAIVIFIVQPGERLAQARDNQREAHLNAVWHAVKEKIYQDEGQWDCTDLDLPEEATVIGSGDGEYDLYSCLYPDFISDPEVFIDPQTGSFTTINDYSTGDYQIWQNTDTEETSLAVGEGHGETRLVHVGFLDSSLAQGEACFVGSECQSEHCVDNVCCDSACSGSICQTCGQYSSNGTGSCGHVNDSGQDPGNDCGTTGCYTGNCSGSGYTCSYHTSGEQNCTTACTTCDGATSGDCVNMTDNTQDTEGSYICSATCKKCSSGSCVNQGTEDLFSQCSDTECYTGDCDGSGACGYQTSGQDLYSYCGTTGCLTGNCIGGSNACGYYASGEQNCTTACTTCNGATSGDCVSMTGDSEDSEGSYTCDTACKGCDNGSCVDFAANEGDSIGSNKCDSSSGTCYRCDGSGCTYQLASQDLWGECSQGSDCATGCRDNDCSGSGYTCGAQNSGQGGCPVCGKCTDSDEACENHDADYYDSGCAVCYGCSSCGNCTNAQNTECNADEYGCTTTDRQCLNGSCGFCPL